jgi:hypothetical protein
MTALIMLAADLVKVGVEYGMASAEQKAKLIATAKEDLAKACAIVDGLEASIAINNSAADALAKAKDDGK